MGRILLTWGGILLGGCLGIMLISFCLLFLKPSVFINPTSAAFLLDKTAFFKSWNWDEARFNFSWRAWNKRNFQGKIKNFCFHSSSHQFEIQTCLEEVSWNLDFFWNLQNGFSLKGNDQILISSKWAALKIFSEKKVKSSSAPNLWKIWQGLWQDWMPCLLLKIKKIKFLGLNQDLEFDFFLLKERNKMFVESLGYELYAQMRGFLIHTSQKLNIPTKFKTKIPLEITFLFLTGGITPKGILLSLEGKLTGVDFHARSFLPLPLSKGGINYSLKKSLLLNFSGGVRIKSFSKLIHMYLSSPYNELPAPFHLMDGKISFEVSTSDLEHQNKILLETRTHIHLRDKKQALHFLITGFMPFNLKEFSRGVLELDITFKEVTLALPRLSRKSRPPQFFPDKRFKSQSEKIVNKNKSKVPLISGVSFHLKALEDKALHIHTNLLESPLRLNFDLEITGAHIDEGFIKILPLKTTFFKRPVHIKNLLFSFTPKNITLVSGVIDIPLPEYKITLSLEGSLSDPQYVFASDPALPQRDIAAVLLFGRPLEELGPEDQSMARQTNQILAQGILSLSLLYFLGESPVEYIGYDPETKKATAQIGLGRKSSFRLGAGAGGGVAGVRRSLGKGWYLDTSVENQNPSNKEAQNFGVLLERIIAY